MPIKLPTVEKLHYTLCLCNEWLNATTLSNDAKSCCEVLDAQRVWQKSQEEGNWAQLQPCQLLHMNFIWQLLPNALHPQWQP